MTVEVISQLDCSEFCSTHKVQSSNKIQEISNSVRVSSCRSGINRETTFKRSGIKVIYSDPPWVSENGIRGHMQGLSQ